MYIAMDKLGIDNNSFVFEIKKNHEKNVKSYDLLKKDFENFDNNGLLTHEPFVNKWSVEKESKEQKVFGRDLSLSRVNMGEKI
jgi:hypothetical protein